MQVTDDSRNEIANKFWSHVTVAGANECWEWTEGQTTTLGYGRFQLAKGLLPGLEGPQQAHRVAYFLEHNRWPGVLHVCHSCDNRACCNPHHLWLGDHKANMEDMMLKGRHGNGPTGVAPYEQRDNLIVELYESYAPIRDIADLARVSRPTVYKVLREHYGSDVIGARRRPRQLNNK